MLRHCSEEEAEDQIPPYVDIVASLLEGTTQSEATKKDKLFRQGVASAMTAQQDNASVAAASSFVLWGTKYVDTTSMYKDNNDELHAKILTFLEDEKGHMKFSARYPANNFAIKFTKFKSLNDDVMYNSRAFSTTRREALLMQNTTARTGVCTKIEGNSTLCALKVHFILTLTKSIMWSWIYYVVLSSGCLAYGNIADFVTVTIVVFDMNDVVVSTIEENCVLLQNYAAPTIDAKSGLPAIDKSKPNNREGIRVAAMTDVIAAVNYASIYSLTQKDRHLHKYVVITEKQMK